MGSDLPGEGIEGGRLGGKRGEGGEGKERCVFYWGFGGEAKGASSKESLRSSSVVVVEDSAGCLPSRVYRGAAGARAAAQLIRGFAHVHTLLRLRGW